MKRSAVVTPSKSYGPKRPRFQGTRLFSKRYAKKPGRTDIYKIVKNVLSRNMETEVTSHTLALTNFNSGIDSTGDVQRVLPAIPQGTDDGNRKGSVIMAKSLNIRGHIELNQMDQLTNSFVYGSNSRVMVRLMVVTPKRFPTWAQSSTSATTWLPNLLRNGANVQGFTGIVQDLYLPLNIDEVTVHWDQLFDLRQNQFSAFSSTSDVSKNVAVDPTGSYAFFNFNIKVKDKKILFLDGSSEPTNFGPVLLMGYAHLDNSSPDVVTSRVQMSYVSTLKYTDA